MTVNVHKPRGPFAPLPMRLVLIQKLPDVAARARARAQRASRKDQRQRTHPLTLEAADHLILITSLPREAFPIERLGALYRLRWQVELAFKRMKSLLRIDRLPAKATRSPPPGCTPTCSLRSSSRLQPTKRAIFPLKPSPNPARPGPPPSGGSSRSWRVASSPPSGRQPVSARPKSASQKTRACANPPENENSK